MENCLTEISAVWAYSPNYRLIFAFRVLRCVALMAVLAGGYQKRAEHVVGDL